MRKIWVAFLVIILTLIILILSLMHGINIESISMPKLKIRELYIKLDKKLIVEANQIEIKRESRAKNSTYEIYKLAKYGKYLNQFFQMISLKNIKYENEIVNILYKNDIFYLNSNYLTIDARLKEVNKGNLDIDLKQMILKDYGMELSGKVILDMKKNIYNYAGKFDILNINGKLNLYMEKEKVYYRISTQNFATLAPIMKYIESKVYIEPIVSAWIYKNIVAKEYKLNHLEGMFNLKTEEFFPFLMKGDATVKDATIKFHPNVTPAIADKINVELNDNTLSFKLTNPTYEKKKIHVNDIHIYNLLTTNTGIIVDLNSTSLLDQPVQSILQAFKINLPITQKSGTNKSHIALDIKFYPYAINAKGNFLVENSLLNIEGVDFFTKHAKIRLDNNRVFITNSNISYKNIFNANTTGVFNTNTKEYDGFANINALNIGLKNKSLLAIKNLRNQPFSLMLNKNTSIFSFHDLNTTLSFAPNNNKIKIDDISKYKDFSPLIKDYNLSTGKVEIKTKKFQNFDANLKLDDVSTPFYYKNKNIKDLDINISTKADKIKAFTNDKKLQLFYDKDLVVNLADLDIRVADMNHQSNAKNMILINGKNVNFKIKDFNSTILSDHFTLNIEKKHTSFISIYKNSQIGYEEYNGNFSLEATKLNDTFVNKALNSDIFKDGSFVLTVNGSNEGIFDGKVYISDSTLVGSSVFNNMMAIINTIPSLVLLRNPSFNENGYVIKDGEIDFKRINQIVSFSKIELHGYNTDISGYGYINLDSKSIDLDLQVKTLKDVSNVVKNIPLLGYIVLGDDKSISTNIKVTGALTNPQIKTQMFKDSVMTPVNIFKRAIESPFKLFK